MASPFFDAIKAGVSGTPGTGSITIGAVVSGFRAFSNVSANSLVDYRIEDGSDWEIGTGLWNGTTLTRGVKYSSTGSPLPLSSAATVSLVISADKVQPHIGGGKWGMWSAVPGATTGSTFGLPTLTASGTPSANTPAATTVRARAHSITYTSASTANAAAGLTLPTAASVTTSSTAFRGGFEFVGRFATNDAIPPRVLFGLSFSPALSSDPSALSDIIAFAKDNADAAMSLMTRAGSSGSATKAAVSVPWVADTVYEVAIWMHPGQLKVFWSIANVGSGAVAYGETTTTLPTAESTLRGALLVGNASSGFAQAISPQSIYLRSSF